MLLLRIAILGVLSMRECNSFQVPRRSSTSRSGRISETILFASVSGTGSIDSDSNADSTSPSGGYSQVAEFIEPTTGVTVKIVGSMHYNPASIELAKNTISELGEERKLGSIIIESCDLRWNSKPRKDPK